MQRKLEIGAVNDPLEREAERAAAQVTRMPVPHPASDPDETPHRSSNLHAANPSAPRPDAPLQRKCACGGACDKCKAERGDHEHGKAPLKIRPAGSSAANTAAPAIVHDVLSEPGRPLDAATRAFFEARFDRNFSRVRVHSGATAAASARAVNALAYTVGNHIVFRSDEFNQPETEQRSLVAHELTHVIQQETSPSAASAERGAGTPAQFNVLRRQPAKQPDEPLDVALARQDRLDRIVEYMGKLLEGVAARSVDAAEHEAKVGPFFVQEDQAVKLIEQQIASGRTEVPAQIAKLQASLRAVGRDALMESDDLNELSAKIRLVELKNSFMPELLRDTAEYQALLKEQKGREKDYTDTLAFFDKVRQQIERTKQFRPQRAAELRKRMQYLQTQAGSAAKTAGVGPDTQVSIDQLTLLRTIIEASPTLRPWLTQQPATGHQPTDLRNAQRFVIESSDGDLQDQAKKCNQGPAGPGTKIGGFYCRQTDTIHLPPDAKFGHALHESIHKYSQLILSGGCSSFLNEGLTQYFADIVLQDQGLPKFTGHAYQNELKCATRFVKTYGLDQVAPAYFLGMAGLGTGTLHQFLLRKDRACTKFCAPEQGAND